ncbi:hexokinase family protein, partial [Striga asiatica]
MNLDFYFYLITDEATGKKKLKVNAWFSSRVTTVAIRTALSYVTNLINGVRKGYRYKMHFVYTRAASSSHSGCRRSCRTWRRSVTSASTHLIETYPSLQPKTAVFTHNDGQPPPGHGTVPIFFQGVTYNIPVIMWLMDSSPEERAIHMQAEIATSCMHFAASLLVLDEGCATPVWLVDAMAVEMHAGLASEGGSKLKMLLTYICDLPTGNEKGIYYALDLGGTDFRVLRELFDYIETSLKDFVEREENASEPSQGEKSRLGFTFSFPVKQTSSSSVKLTNGFSIDYMVVRDVALCFPEAIYRKSLNMQVASL